VKKIRIRSKPIAALLLVAGFFTLALNLNPVVNLLVLLCVVLPGSFYVLSDPHEPQMTFFNEIDDKLAGTIESTVLLIRCARQSLKICVRTLNQPWLCDPKMIAALYQLPPDVTIEIVTADLDLTVINPLLVTWIEERRASVVYQRPSKQQFIITDDENIILEVRRPTEDADGLTAMYLLTRKLGLWYANRFDRLKSAAA